MDTLRVNGKSGGTSNGDIDGAGSVYSSLRLLARFFAWTLQFRVFSKKYLKFMDCYVPADIQFKTG